MRELAQQISWELQDLTMPLEVGECVLCLPEASSAVNSEAKPRIGQSHFAAWLSGSRNGEGWRWGAGATLYSGFALGQISKEPSL